MFIGHALLAFALTVLIADWRGWPAGRALTVGLVAGTFAALPDVDVVYAVFTLDIGQFLGRGTVDPGAFWGATREVHRTMTHSLVVALIAGPAFGLWTIRGANAERPIGVLCVLAGLLLASLVVVGILASGPLGGIVMGAFVAAGVGVATLCRVRTDLSPAVVALAATAGLASHPWGDLVTGHPPALLYPLRWTPFEGRIVLHADPTIHLLGAFALELAVIWLAVVALVRVTDRSWLPPADRSALAGTAYGVVALAMTPPTLDVSYHFVFSILAVGLLCGGVSAYRSKSLTIDALGDVIHPMSQSRFRFVASTALSGITTALVAYALVYVAL